MSNDPFCSMPLMFYFSFELVFFFFHLVLDCIFHEDPVRLGSSWPLSRIFDAA